LQRVGDALASVRSGAPQTRTDTDTLADPKSPTDKILKQGYLTKQGNRIKTWKVRWFVLTPTALAYHKSYQKELVDQIPLATVEKVEDGYSRSGVNNSIAVVTPSRTYIMYAESPQERDDWILELRKWLKVVRESS